MGGGCWTAGKGGPSGSPAMVVDGSAGCSAGGVAPAAEHHKAATATPLRTESTFRTMQRYRAGGC